MGHEGGPGGWCRRGARGKRGISCIRGRRFLDAQWDVVPNLRDRGVLDPKRDVTKGEGDAHVEGDREDLVGFTTPLSREVKLQPRTRSETTLWSTGARRSDDPGRWWQKYCYGRIGMLRCKQIRGALVHAFAFYIEKAMG
eukprot:scaffold37_cov346-Pavlova_lutheri.AAC.18